MGAKSLGKCARMRLFYEKSIPHISNGEAIESCVDDVLSFSDPFSGRCPPLRISGYWCIRVALEIRLIPAKLFDLRSESSGRGVDERKQEDCAFTAFLERA